MDTQNHQRQPPSTTAGFNLNHQQQQPQPQPQHDFSFITTNITKQHMFEKLLTPSDVGKLNRLVIPKQHAEKHFPLGNEVQRKGLVLSFEDEAGKLWRFRYSYWNSSQSYVLTKGWSRYVKEKRLDAGDVVLFHRHMLDCEKMFIGWRRRFADVPETSMTVETVAPPFYSGARVSQMFYDDQSGYPTHHLNLVPPLPYQRDCLHEGKIFIHLLWSRFYNYYTYEYIH